MTDMSDVDTGDRLYHVRKSRLIRLINWWEVRNLLDELDSVTRSMPLPPCMISLVLATAMTLWDSLAVSCFSFGPMERRFCVLDRGTLHKHLSELSSSGSALNVPEHWYISACESET